MKKNFIRSMMVMLILIAAIIVCMGAIPAFADSIPSNIEYMDEVDLVYEVGGSDFIYGSEKLDIGVMTGISNLGNPWNDEKTNSYVMVKVDVKKIRIVNRLWGWFTSR